jgi:DNA polymerase III subunit epsilon
MRQIFLDTETTGLSPESGDRIIEIGCVEILDRRISERVYHAYLNPEREVELGATRVHGLTREDLMAKPKFAEVAREFLDFVAGAEVIIHNADFDVEFLDLELGRARLKPLKEHVGQITDTLLLSRELNPGRKASLDALCERYAIDNTHRTLHGALLDARLLAECYLAMTRGQESLMMELETPAAAAAALAALQIDVSSLLVVTATPDEVARHEQVLDAIEKEAKGGSLWRRILKAA